jgi:hypothetical protein
MPSRRTPILIMRYVTSFGHPPPDLDFITDNLAVGGALRTDEQIQALPALGIGAVVDMRAESTDNVAELERQGIHFLRLPTIDWHPPTQDDLDAGVAWAMDEMAQGRKVLIHCQHGIGRSVILAAAVLVKQGRSWQDALEHIGGRRFGAAPHGDQVDALIEYARRLKDEAAYDRSP